MSGYEITAFYGRSHTRTTVFVYPTGYGWWYVCDGSMNINFTSTEPAEYCDVEEIQDDDYMHADDPITSLEQLEREIEENT